ncbi:MAG: cyclic nucleotide-binding domain-containing protein [Sulfitobacter sp.]
MKHHDRSAELFRTPPIPSCATPVSGAVLPRHGRFKYNRKRAREVAADNAPPLEALFQTQSFPHCYQPGTVILLDGDPADGIYKVASGTVRCCTISAEGHRQIFRFASKGDVIGMTDIENWHFTAEAVDHVTLEHIPRTALERALAVDGSVRLELRREVCTQLQNRENQLLSLIHSKASKRLYSFLRDFSATRKHSGFVALPMCRRNIADHLGMTIETVSRAFGVLKADQRIDLTGPEKFRITGAPITEAIGNGLIGSAPQT